MVSIKKESRVKTSREVARKRVIQGRPTAPSPGESGCLIESHVYCLYVMSDVAHPYSLLLVGIVMTNSMFMGNLLSFVVRYCQFLQYITKIIFQYFNLHLLSPQPHQLSIDDEQSDVETLTKCYLMCKRYRRFLASQFMNDLSSCYRCHSVYCYGLLIQVSRRI